MPIGLNKSDRLNNVARGYLLNLNPFFKTHNNTTRCDSVELTTDGYVALTTPYLTIPAWKSGNTANTPDYLIYVYSYRDKYILEEELVSTNLRDLPYNGLFEHIKANNGYIINFDCGNKRPKSSKEIKDSINYFIRAKDEKGNLYQMAQNDGGSGTHFTSPIPISPTSGGSIKKIGNPEVTFNNFDYDQNGAIFLNFKKPKNSEYQANISFIISYTLLPGPSQQYYSELNEAYVTAFTKKDLTIKRSEKVNAKKVCDINEYTYETKNTDADLDKLYYFIFEYNSTFKKSTLKTFNEIKNMNLHTSDNINVIDYIKDFNIKKINTKMYNYCGIGNLYLDTYDNSSTEDVLAKGLDYIQISSPMIRINDNPYATNEIGIIFTKIALGISFYSIDQEDHTSLAVD